MKSLILKTFLANKMIEENEFEKTTTYKLDIFKVWNFVKKGKGQFQNLFCLVKVAKKKELSYLSLLLIIKNREIYS